MSTASHHIGTIPETAIRKTYDERSRQWYFSVIDVIALITESADARNYWKVTKSRFTKTNPQLVTGCIQLELPSSDGKLYATDTADTETMLGLIEAISPASLPQFRRWFDDIEYETKKDIHSPHAANEKLPVDFYETSTHLVIECIVAGVPINDITIGVRFQNLSITVNRPQPSNTSSHYATQELAWGMFSREISFHTPIDIHEITATECRGILTIRILKIDTDRTRIIKVREV